MNTPLTHDRPPLVIWRLIDGKPGHEKQTTGLAQAIARLTPARIHTVRAPDFWPCLRDLILKRFTGAEELPAPDLILGAGHGTHLALLAARRARGGKAICLMRPSLPIGLFDLCLIPNHDRPPARDNVIATRGVLNAVVPSDRHDPKRGLFLIGGASSHYRWDNAEIARQVLTLARETPDIQWQLTTSRRTPEDFLDHLEARRPNNLSLHPHTETPPGWLEAALAESGRCWVTEDSVSMLYEALTAGCAVGLLRLPSHRPSRIGRGVEELIAEGRVTPFEDRQRRPAIYMQEPRKLLDPSPPRKRGASLIKEMDGRSSKLRPTALFSLLRGNDGFFEVPMQDSHFDEAERCARAILSRWY